MNHRIHLLGVPIALLPRMCAAAPDVRFGFDAVPGLAFSSLLRSLEAGTEGIFFAVTGEAIPSLPGTREVGPNSKFDAATWSAFSPRNSGQPKLQRRVHEMQQSCLQAQKIFDVSDPRCGLSDKS